MKKTLIMIASVLFLGSNVFAQNVTGIWQTIDDETNKPKSVVSIYEYNNKVFGRIIMTYEDDGVTVKDTMYLKKYTADKVAGNPLMCGLDIIWDMNKEKESKKYKKGKIMDPLKGKIYNSEMWCAENGDLIVRGKIAFFGKNQTWKSFDVKNFPADFIVPDTTNWEPVIPKTK
ncbi:MAG: DUF2147 domain-containing protein [Endomicrobiaceae bacterium]|nr:DUF2147 domain-containing protein [Endomicrobiaceae bacterium]